MDLGQFDFEHSKYQIILKKIFVLLEDTKRNTVRHCHPYSYIQNNKDVFKKHDNNNNNKKIK